MVTLLPFTLGYALDLLVGDPAIIPHPVRGVGLLISKSESILRRNEKFLYFKGVILFLIVVSISYIIPKIILHFIPVIEFFLIFQILATKSLYTETNKVYKALKNGDITLAKKELSYLVTRDCEDMEVEDIVRSTIETISENIVDGITSPLFYSLLGGAPLGFAYKGVNTLDSMVGYKNSKYIKFGFFSAKMDDFINYIPARITSIFIIFSSFILRYNYKESFLVFLRDRKNHASPNSGYAESPVAGALGIELGGKVSYFGIQYSKPTMGNNNRAPVLDDIKKSHKIMCLTSFLFFAVSSGIVYGLK